MKAAPRRDKTRPLLRLGWSAGYVGLSPTLGVVLIVALADFALLFSIGLLLSGCAVDSTIQPEVRTTTVQVQVPVPVPCFTDDQRPIAPKPTPIDPETATTEQLAAAELADAEAWRDYTRAVDALFLQCSSKGTTP